MCHEKHKNSWIGLLISAISFNQLTPCIEGMLSLRAACLIFTMVNWVALIRYNNNAIVSDNFGGVIIESILKNYKWIQRTRSIRVIVLLKFNLMLFPQPVSNSTEFINLGWLFQLLSFTIVGASGLVHLYLFLLLLEKILREDVLSLEPIFLLVQYLEGSFVVLAVDVQSGKG